MIDLRNRSNWELSPFFKSDENNMMDFYQLFTENLQEKGYFVHLTKMIT